MPKVFEYRDIPRADLDSAIRCCLYWLEELVEEGASDDRIDEVVQLMRPVFAEYQKRMNNLQN